MKNFYYILGTPSNCSAAEITEAYRKLALKFHPGSTDHDPFFETHYREICEAHEILSDPIKRRKYDAALKKSHQRQFYHFKTGYVNIAATLALVTLVVIFGLYVIKSVNTTNSPAKVATIQPMVEQPKLKHHKKKHFARIKLLTKKTIPAAVTTTRVAAAVQQIKADPVSKAIVHNNPLVVAASAEKPDSTYTTYLKASLGSMVYLHENADYMSAVVTVLPSHSKLKVLQKGQNFYKVAFNNQTGYVPKWTLTSP